MLQGETGRKKSLASGRAKKSEKTSCISCASCYLSFHELNVNATKSLHRARAVKTEVASESRAIYRKALAVGVAWGTQPTKGEATQGEKRTKLFLFFLTFFLQIERRPIS